MVVKDQPSVGVSQTWVHRPAKIHYSLCDLRGRCGRAFFLACEIGGSEEKQTRDLHSAWRIVSARYAGLVSIDSIWPLRESFVHEQIFIRRLLSVRGCSSVGSHSDERDKVPAHREQIVNQ